MNPRHRISEPVDTSERSSVQCVSVLYTCIHTLISIVHMSMHWLCGQITTGFITAPLVNKQNKSASKWEHPQTHQISHSPFRKFIIHSLINWRNILVNYFFSFWKSCGVSVIYIFLRSVITIATCGEKEQSILSTMQQLYAWGLKNEHRLWVRGWTTQTPESASTSRSTSSF